MNFTKKIRIDYSYLYIESSPYESTFITDIYYNSKLTYFNLEISDICNLYLNNYMTNYDFEYEFKI